MLNYLNAEDFFENCLLKCGLTDGWSQPVPTLAKIEADAKLKAAIVKTLNDIRTGADAVFARGKPQDTSLDLDEWERRWSAWTSARTTAFHSRAALMLLGDKNYFSYFLDVLRSSHNIVFLGGANDVLQHATGHYLSGPAEELTKDKLAAYWEQRGI